VVVHDVGFDAALAQLGLRELVDADVSPAVVGRKRLGPVGKALALPWHVVMAQQRAAAAQRVGHCSSGARVERQRANVLGDDEIGVAEHRAQLVDRRRVDVVGRVVGETRVNHVGEAVPGDGQHVVVEAPECADPLRRLDGHAVGVTQAIRHHYG
jgi:hypothetical protein